MAHALRFQVLVLPNTSWSEALRRFRYLEDLGFDVAGTADHFVDWTNPPSPWLEQWTLLAAVAAATTRIRLATCVAQIPFRNPALLARQALTVDHVSSGRLELGLGTGLVSDPSYPMMGIPSWSAGERVARFAEYVEVVDRLLSSEITTYKGRFYEVDGAVMNPRPVQEPRPPITIAAMAPIMMKHAARHADVWNSLSFVESFEAQLEETRGRIAFVDEACAAIGRDPASLRRSYLMFDALARPKGGLIRYYESEAVLADMARRLIDLGISEIGLYYPTRDEQLPVFERIARSVLPELRGKDRARRGS
jgi:alkanesulfonate monooxygenase SsuD/methylene tetrahydromethanopterin reductase-like flavin-dependent oxidoreductase (luciferase family)